MRFFRWLLSNIILIIVIITLIYTYVYWGNLTGAETPGGKVIAYLSTQSPVVHQFIGGINNKKPQEDRSTANASPPLIQPPVAIRYRHNNQQSLQHSTGKANAHYTAEANESTLSPDVNKTEKTEKHHLFRQSTSIQPVHTTPVIKQVPHNPAQLQQAKKANKFVSAAVEQELENAGAAGDVAALTPDATRAVWIKARKSFYQHEYAQSEKRYRRVIAMTKDNFDAYGELGNVYFNQGKNDKAADAYMAAATILIKQGKVERARSLVGLMHYLNQDKARQLKQKLEAAQ